MNDPSGRCRATRDPGARCGRRLQKRNIRAIVRVDVSMKTKLTITVSKDLVPRAKRFARKRGTSLSAVIEEALRAATSKDVDFVERWRGRFQLRDKDAQRFRYLKDKYLADTD